MRDKKTGAKKAHTEKPPSAPRKDRDTEVASQSVVNPTPAADGGKVREDGKKPPAGSVL